VRFLKAFALGAATAYLFDSRDGKRRRAMLRDRALRLLGQARGRLVGKSKHVAGHARGVAATTRSHVVPPTVETDDETVRQRILSDAFRDVPVSASNVDVQVHDGVATLRGSVDDESLVDALVRRVSQTPGVTVVKQELAVR
jgi:osmotically-inducible protein OsmY